MKIKTLFFIVPLVFTTGCSFVPSAGSPQKHPVIVKSNTVNYGNGVYYIHEIESNFGHSLSEFLATHPCKIEGIAGDGTGSKGYDRGYWIVCR